MSRFLWPKLPPSWRVAPFKHLARLSYGASLPAGERAGAGDVPVYGSSGRVGMHDEALHPGPSIIIGRKGTVGAVHYESGPFWPIDTAFYLDDIDTAVNVRYLAYVLQALDLSRLVIVVGVPGINRKDIQNIPIPLPPLSEQQRIADILDAAEELRRKRAEADELAGQLVPALFYEMFGNGDPRESYPSGWEITRLGRLIKSTQYGISTDLQDSEAVGVLRMNNITTDGWLDLTELRYIADAKVDFRLYDLQEGDILFNRTNSRELVGKTGLWERQEKEYTFASYIIRVRLEEDIAPEYVWAVLNSPYGKARLFQMAKPAVNMSNINANELRSIPIVLPLKPLRDEFAQQVKAIKHQRRLMMQAGAPFDELRSSLLARAFTGALTASWREANQEHLAREAAERDLRLTGTRPVVISETGTMTATARASGKDVYVPHPRHALLRALSGQQRELCQVVSADDEYVTPERLRADGVPVDLARRGLELLAAMGLVAGVDVVTQGEGDRPQFVRAYRGLRTRGETWPGDDARLEDLAALGGGSA